jgi:hypothetical protein
MVLYILIFANLSFVDHFWGLPHTLVGFFIATRMLKIVYITEGLFFLPIFFAV